MIQKIKLVTFDMAGTTIQDQKEVEKCFAKACMQAELEVSKERILALQGYAKREVFEMLWGEVIINSPAELAMKVESSYNLFCNILENHYLNSTIVPTDYCLETFEWLRSQDIKIALTTGFYRKVANIILEKVGWLQGLDGDFVNTSGKSPIDISVTPSEVAKGRPAPHMIKHAMYKLGIEDTRLVINIGDTPVDLEFGYNANVLLSLGITNGTHTRAQLEKEKNDGLINNLSELPEIIKAL